MKEYIKKPINNQVINALLNLVLHTFRIQP